MASYGTKSKLSCRVCKKPISGARTVIEGAWYCADCTYKYDYPDREIPEVEPTPRGEKQKQKETLFPLPKKERK